MIAGGTGNLLLTPSRRAACRAPHHREAAQRARRPDRRGLSGPAAGRPSGRQGAAVDDGVGVRDSGAHRQARRRRTAARDRRARACRIRWRWCSCVISCIPARTAALERTGRRRPHDRRRRRLQGRLDRGDADAGRATGRPRYSATFAGSGRQPARRRGDRRRHADRPARNHAQGRARAGNAGASAARRAAVERLLDPVARRGLCGGRGAFTTVERWYEAHRMASEVARATSEPPRGVSIQAFGIFPKIREIDALLRARPELRPARHRIAPGSGVLAAQWRAGDAPAEEGEGPGQSGRDGGAARAACRPRLRRGFPGVGAAARRGSRRFPRRLRIAVHRRAPCARARRGPFRIRRAWTRIGIPIAIWA